MKIKYLILVISKVLTLCGSIGTAYVISTYFDKIQQGYYYGFQSLGAIGFFFDLGIGFVLANIASREIAKLKNNEKKESGKIYVIIKYAARWTLVSCLIFYIVAVLVGNYLFADYLQNSWRFFCGALAIQLAMSIQITIYEAIGKILEVAIIRVLQSLIFITILYLGSKNFQIGIEALPWAIIGSVIPGIFWLLLIFYRNININKNTVSEIKWKKDIYPLQWRVGVSWISGYFIFQAPIIYIYKNIGPVEAGQLGLSLQIFQAITSFASLILTTKTKQWAKLSINKKINELKNDYWRVAIISIGFVLMISIVLRVLGEVNPYITEAYLSRIVGTENWIVLTMASIANQLFFSMNYFFRAQGREPLWFVAAMSGIAAIIAANYIIDILTITLLIYCYAAICILMHAFGSVLVYKIKS